MWLIARFPTVVRPPLAESGAGFAPISRLPFTSTDKGELENAFAFDRTGTTPFVGFIEKQSCGDLLARCSSSPAVADCATAVLQKTDNKSRNAIAFIVNPFESSPGFNNDDQEDPHSEQWARGGCRETGKTNRQKAKRNIASASPRVIPLRKVAGASGRGRNQALLLRSVAQFWYQSIVFCNPSTSEVLARKPNSRSARVTSRRRRGWPSGCIASQMSSPSNPVNLHSNVANSRTVISCPDPMFTGSGLL